MHMAMACCPALWTPAPPPTHPAAGTPAPPQQDAGQDGNHQRFALLCIGELGRRADLTAFPALPDALTAALGSGERAGGWLPHPLQGQGPARVAARRMFWGERHAVQALAASPPAPATRSAPLHLPYAELIAESASTALGGVAAGNLGAYLPLLLQHVHSQAQNPKQLYQLLKVGGGGGGG